MPERTLNVRGFDLDPAEVEQALRAWPACAEAVVLLRPSAEGAPVLTAYVVLAQDAGGAPWEPELAGFLRERLPPYMVPAAFAGLDRIPRTAQGAVDEAALPAPVVHEEPLSEPERLLAALLARLIGCPVEKLGPHDDHFLLGGDSVTVVQLLAHFESWTDREVDVEELFELGTVRLLAEFLDSLHPDWYAAALAARELESAR
ncbi:non-ribosomal peptide synthetase [Streptomyces sp. NPDC046909]|uniref:non-ribosomal peptide synthetase n=1 Tax=Streptomyces sp. NPDC046909 TaxID=3155617 RepID=UPI0033F0C2E3